MKRNLLVLFSSRNKDDAFEAFEKFKKKLIVNDLTGMTKIDDAYRSNLRNEILCFDEMFNL